MPGLLRRKSVPLLLALAMVAAAGSALALGLEETGLTVNVAAEGGGMRPEGLWYDGSRGRLLLPDPGASTVLVLDVAGAPVKTVGKDGGLQAPCAAAVSPGGTLYVAERRGEQVKILPRYDAVEPEGFRVLNLASYRQGSEVQPRALIIDDSGSLYLADRGNRQLLVFGADDRLKFRIANLGEPAALWVDAGGRILVAEPGFGGIRIYDRGGKWLRTVGAGSRQFREPLRAKAVVTDRLGRIWTLQEGDDLIRAIDQGGNLLFSRSLRELGLPGWLAPAAMTIDAHDQLLVLDQGGRRIAVLRITGF